jgi:tripartite-type tricarboxylate transporter receptor subunit TctC
MSCPEPRFSRRRLLLSAAAVTALQGQVSFALAAEFPDRPIKFIVPFNAGGNVDSVGRLMATAMGQQLRQTIIVENRAGAGGSLGAGLVAQGPADGYTLMVGSNGPLTINPFVLAKLSYKPLEDLAPVALVGTVPHVLIVNAELPAKNLAELVALSKQRQVNCASSGIGSATHLTMERFNAQTGARLQHVPYRGGGSLVPDLLGGTVGVASMELSTALPLHRGGKARILAVAGEGRNPLAPELPSFIDSGIKDFVAQSFVGLLAPRHTPAAVLQRLERAALAALDTAETKERLQAIGMQPSEPDDRTAVGFGKLLRADHDRTRDAVKAAGIKPE